MGRKVLMGVLFGAVVYAGMLLWLDGPQVLEALRGFPLWLLPAACSLSFANYAIRFVKWERYRRLLEIDLPLGTSFLVYLSGLSMSITPGKMGEVFKSWLIRRVDGTPIHRSAPIVVAERFTDLLGYLILVAIGGISTLPEHAWVFWATLGLCVVALPVAGSRRVARWVCWALSKLPYLWRLSGRVEGAFASTRILLRPREVVGPTLLSVISWGCECTGFWLIANALTDFELPYVFAVFAFAFSAVAGALAVVVPAGLGVTEGLLGTLLVRKIVQATGVAREVARPQAGGAVILTRLCTLWFAVAVGLVATLLFQRRYGRVEPDAAD
jgi:uncharacterized protein (TIRG00374 family)